MGLPEKISFGANQRIENTYDASGMKLSQKIINGSTVTQTDYMGGLIYRNGVVETIYHDEGRVKIDNGNLTQQHYQFFITDHLGNNRIIIERLNATTAIVQETHYYPFGAVMEGVGVTGDWKFLYQGNELIEFNDYDTYDFNLRQYDPYRGQFTAIDPIDNYSIGGYAAMLNNPLTYTDPNGDCPNCITGFIGAAIGGVGNLLYQGFNGKLKKPGDYFAAFGIGAAAGFVTGFTGGAAAGAFGLSSTGVASGVVAGSVGALAGDPIRGFGNAAYFKDPYTLSDYGTGVLAGGILGGVAGGGAALFKGKNFWLGTPKLQGTTPFSLSPTKDAINAGFKKGLRGKWLNIEGGDLTFQGVDEVGSLGGHNVGDIAARNTGNYAANVNGAINGIDDIIANPSLLQGRSLSEVQGILKGTQGWSSGSLSQGRSAGSGWTLRQMNNRGTDFTDLYIQFSPGSPRHFGGNPYWKFSSGKTGTIRFPAR